MYSDVKSCVRYNGEISDFIKVTNGLLQGEGLSPFLFSLYTNDFENFLISNTSDNVELRDLSLFLLQYADDTVLFSDSVRGLQSMLDCLHEYTQNWNLSVNVENFLFRVRNGTLDGKRLF